MKLKLRKEAKTDFEKYFFKLMNNYGDIRLVTTDERRNLLASEANYHT